MAIVNTLQKCLESPYLFLDQDAPAQVASLLTLAGERLDAAKGLLGGDKPDPADIGSLAYEAMFASLRALVYAKGYREAGLRCLLLACEHLYVRAGLLDASHVQAFEKAQGQKLLPVDAVDAATSFVARSRELVGS